MRESGVQRVNEIMRRCFHLFSLPPALNPLHRCPCTDAAHLPHLTRGELLVNVPQRTIMWAESEDAGHNPDWGPQPALQPLVCGHEFGGARPKICRHQRYTGQGSGFQIL